VFIDYCCHDHGVVDKGQTLMDHDRLRACPICDGPLFVALGESLPSRHRPSVAGVGGELSRRLELR
jgi:hypothetical protein